ncbi:UTP--glucose-1-phosphate uridylyltransferase GalU [Niallia nealsonii]|uniref:UTP--glucose-1-phosphate uridylyltransferase n=1 Tax=Niallia nealsonii TaxID=115979 RepID=A0A2N0Z4A8_9BACI|nr:UTP--glucose-1-phosphate uridylyltransferase GalU [Niallia nealsonii]PKG24346.1 UTP--glucose-1-phosphate uridylyltransferase [Niallia nealsonii]
MKIRKAIIPAAGLGTRFLPATKTLPKEMLPIIDKPAIQYIIEEAVASGIEEILIVTGRGKYAIEDHFDKSYELEDILLKRHQFEHLHEIQQISSLASIYYVRQKDPLGLGDAILCGKSFIGDEPFAVLLGDDIVHAETPLLQQLIDVAITYHSPALAISEVEESDISKYGIIRPALPPLKENIYKIDALVEKPHPDYAPSRYAIMGRYILPPSIFSILEHNTPEKGKELQLTDAIAELNKQTSILGLDFAGIRYDIGDKLGFIKATIDFSLLREEMREEILAFCKKKLDMFTKEKKN